MSPDPVRVPVPVAFVGLVIAFCAILLLKWLAVIALIVGAVVLLGRALWRRRGRVDPEPAHEWAPEDDLALPEPRDAAGSPGPDDCSWCGLRDGHRDLRGHLIRPRHAHAPAPAPRV